MPREKSAAMNRQSRLEKCFSECRGHASNIKLTADEVEEMRGQYTGLVYLDYESVTQSSHSGKGLSHSLGGVSIDEILN